MSTALPPSKEVDFMILKEDWTRYLVDDGTQLRVRIVVRKILEIDQPNPQGYPNFGLESMNVVSAIVPDRLKRQPTQRPFDPRIEKGNEIRFKKQEPQEQQWQEYLTADGFKVLVQPVLVKVTKYDSYNIFGEPVYNANIQNIVNAEKTDTK